MAQDRFVDEDELVGKTIAKIRMHGMSVDISFTDGSYTCIDYGGGYYAGESEMRFVELDAEELKRLDEQTKPFVDKMADA